MHGLRTIVKLNRKKPLKTKLNKLLAEVVVEVERILEEECDKTPVTFKKGDGFGVPAPFTQGPEFSGKTTLDLKRKGTKK